jgi:hypothetical protein
VRSADAISLSGKRCQSRRHGHSKDRDHAFDPFRRPT